MTVLEADLTWTGERFERGVQVRVADGVIAEVGALGLEADERLGGRALLPGFVNAHSHAFQRAIRGRGEADGSFWTWRHAMYGLVEAMDEATFRRTCVQAFSEMRAAGITCVGEFHYLHHLGGSDDYAFDEMVLEAAAETRIRVVLLNAYYGSGGIGKPLEGGQLRFRSRSPDAYWKQMDRLGSHQLGAVVHSVRAASPEELAEVFQEARRRGLVFHIHLEEQRREIEECLAAHGKRPMQLLLEIVGDNDSVTAVHCTHTADFGGFAGTVCMCPLTEANLGDGIASVGAMPAVCLGTDSNARISVLEEARWLEYVQRLARERRGVLEPQRLLEAATAAGARSLGVPAGRIAPGCWADFAAVDLDAPSLLGWTDETLPAVLVLGAPDSVIAGTCVGGRWTP